MESALQVSHLAIGYITFSVNSCVRVNSHSLQICCRRFGEGPNYLNRVCRNPCAGRQNIPIQMNGTDSVLQKFRQQICHMLMFPFYCLHSLIISQFLFTAFICIQLIKCKYASILSSFSSNTLGCPPVAP